MGHRQSIANPLTIDRLSALYDGNQDKPLTVTLTGIQWHCFIVKAREYLKAAKEDEDKAGMSQMVLAWRKNAEKCFEISAQLKRV